MRIISKKTVEDFIKKHSETENPLKAWYQKVNQAHWKTPQEVKQEYSKKVSILNNNRIVFDIKDKYRLIVATDFKRNILFIKFIGTHDEYDKIEAETYDAYRHRKTD